MENIDFPEGVNLTNVFLFKDTENSNWKAHFDLNVVKCPYFLGIKCQNLIKTLFS